MRIATSLLLLGLTASCLSGCLKAEAPVLPSMEVAKSSQSIYTSALQELDTILQVYYPPEASTIYYYVKPINDATGLSGTGEIPGSITTMVRDAISQISYKVRYVEQYDASDFNHLQVEQMLRQSAKIQTQTPMALRPTADYTITGAISMFDRNLSSSSDEMRGMAAVGGGSGQAQLDGFTKSNTSFSRLGVSFNLFLSNGISVPGKFGGEIDVMLAKNTKDLGFSIKGVGFGIGSEAIAMHGRHQALKMLTEFSVVQIIGNTMSVPYWRVGKQHKIFSEDPHVINSMRNEFDMYKAQPARLIAYMQAQCIANGDKSVRVNGVLDDATQRAFENFGEQYNVPAGINFSMFKALELNRILDVSVASEAWSAYTAYKNGVSSPASQPAAVAKPKPSVSVQSKPIEAESSESNDDTSVESFTKALEGLL